jgi:ATP-dependent protease Clp ATPase subunit
MPHLKMFVPVGIGSLSIAGHTYTPEADGSIEVANADHVADLMRFGVTPEAAVIDRDAAIASMTQVDRDRLEAVYHANRSAETMQAEHAAELAAMQKAHDAKIAEMTAQIEALKTVPKPAPAKK